MTTTAIERAPHLNGNVAPFPGATVDDILGAASDAATKFSDVVKRQRMFRRIGDNDHIQIEAWQTIGALTGILADEGTVTELPWPDLPPLGEEPPIPAGREPRHRDTPEWREWKYADTVRRGWELHDAQLRARALGRAYGFKAQFRAAKNGVAVGWGEGRCNRSEASKVTQEDYALSSMAQTRAQSRALGAPLKFVVKLAGYETTPAEELDNAPAAAAAPEQPFGPVTEDTQHLEQAADLVKIIAGDGVDAHKFIVMMGEHFDGLPVACLTMLRGLARYVGAAHAASVQAHGDPAPENAPPPPGQSAYQGVSPEDVYPPGHRPGD